VPVCRIEAPPGLGTAAKKKMVEKITAAIDEAYHIGDTLVFLQECSPENVALEGRLLSENPKIQEILQKISS
jgi:phenylpyruvate tautomerase PptA (4-oxalocrotonate tautomerase family)